MAKIKWQILCYIYFISIKESKIKICTFKGKKNAFIEKGKILCFQGGIFQILMLWELLSKASGFVPIPAKEENEYILRKGERLHLYLYKFYFFNTTYIALV